MSENQFGNHENSGISENSESSSNKLKKKRKKSKKGLQNEDLSKIKNTQFSNDIIGENSSNIENASDRKKNKSAKKKKRTLNYFYESKVEENEEIFENKTTDENLKTNGKIKKKKKNKSVDENAKILQSSSKKGKSKSSKEIGQNSSKSNIDLSASELHSKIMNEYLDNFDSSDFIVVEAPPKNDSMLGNSNNSKNEHKNRIAGENKNNFVNFKFLNHFSQENQSDGSSSGQSIEGGFRIRSKSDEESSMQSFSENSLAKHIYFDDEYRKSSQNNLDSSKIKDTPNKTKKVNKNNKNTNKSKQKSNTKKKNANKNKQKQNLKPVNQFIIKKGRKINLRRKEKYKAYLSRKRLLKEAMYSENSAQRVYRKFIEELREYNATRNQQSNISNENTIEELIENEKLDKSSETDFPLIEFNFNRKNGILNQIKYLQTNNLKIELKIEHLVPPEIANDFIPLNKNDNLELKFKNAPLKFRTELPANKKLFENLNRFVEYLKQISGDLNQLDDLDLSLDCENLRNLEVSNNFENEIESSKNLENLDKSIDKEMIVKTEKDSKTSNLEDVRLEKDLVEDLNMSVDQPNESEEVIIESSEKQLENSEIQEIEESLTPIIKNEIKIFPDTSKNKVPDNKDSTSDLIESSENLQELPLEENINSDDKLSEFLNKSISSQTESSKTNQFENQTKLETIIPENVEENYSQDLFSDQSFSNIETIESNCNTIKKTEKSRIKINCESLFKNKKSGIDKVTQEIDKETEEILNKDNDLSSPVKLCKELKVVIVPSPEKLVYSKMHSEKNTENRIEESNRKTTKNDQMLNKELKVVIIQSPEKLIYSKIQSRKDKSLTEDSFNDTEENYLRSSKNVMDLDENDPDVSKSSPNNCINEVSKDQIENPDSTNLNQDIIESSENILTQQTPFSSEISEDMATEKSNKDNLDKESSIELNEMNISLDQDHSISDKDSSIDVIIHSGDSKEVDLEPVNDDSNKKSIEESLEVNSVTENEDSSSESENSICSKSEKRKNLNRIEVDLIVMPKIESVSLPQKHISSSISDIESNFVNKNNGSKDLEELDNTSNKQSKKEKEKLRELKESEETCSIIRDNIMSSEDEDSICSTYSEKLELIKKKSENQIHTKISEYLEKIDLTVESQLEAKSKKRKKSSSPIKDVEESILNDKNKKIDLDEIKDRDELEGTSKNKKRKSSINSKESIIDLNKDKEAQPKKSVNTEHLPSNEDASHEIEKPKKRAARSIPENLLDTYIDNLIKSHIKFGEGDEIIEINSTNTPFKCELFGCDDIAKRRKILGLIGCTDEANKSIEKPKRAKSAVKRPRAKKSSSNGESKRKKKNPISKEDIDQDQINKSVVVEEINKEDVLRNDEESMEVQDNEVEDVNLITDKRKFNQIDTNDTINAKESGSILKNINNEDKPIKKDIVNSLKNNLEDFVDTSILMDINDEDDHLDNFTKDSIVQESDKKDIKTKKDSFSEDSSTSEDSEDEEKAKENPVKDNSVNSKETDFTKMDAEQELTEDSSDSEEDEDEERVKENLVKDNSIDSKETDFTKMDAEEELTENSSASEEDDNIKTEEKVKENPAKDNSANVKKTDFTKMNAEEELTKDSLATEDENDNSEEQEESTENLLVKNKSTNPKKSNIPKTNIEDLVNKESEDKLKTLERIQNNTQINNLRAPMQEDKENGNILQNIYGEKNSLLKNRDTKMTTVEEPSGKSKKESNKSKDNETVSKTKPKQTSIQSYFQAKPDTSKNLDPPIESLEKQDDVFISPQMIKRSPRKIKIEAQTPKSSKNDPRNANKSKVNDIEPKNENNSDISFEESQLTDPQTKNTSSSPTTKNFFEKLQNTEEIIMPGCQDTSDLLNDLLRSKNCTNSDIEAQSVTSRTSRSSRTLSNLLSNYIRKTTTENFEDDDMSVASSISNDESDEETKEKSINDSFINKSFDYDDVYSAELSVCHSQLESITKMEFKGLERKKIALLHKLHPRSSALPAETRKILRMKRIKVKTGTYTKKEDQQILSNWTRFCQLHNLDDQLPGPFLVFRRKDMPSFKDSERQKFLYHLGQGLNDRLLNSVYNRFKRLFIQVKKNHGRYTEEEDEEIIKYLNESDDPSPFITLAKKMNRDQLSVRKRVDYLMQIKNLKSGLGKVQWTMDFMAKFVKYLLRYAECDDISDLERCKISLSDWRKISKKMKVPVPRLKAFWYLKLYPGLFLPDDIIASDFVDQVSKLILKKGYEEWKRVNWLELSNEIIEIYPGFNSLFLNRVFKRVIKDHVPPSYKTVKETLNFLKKIPSSEITLALNIERFAVDDNRSMQRHKRLIQPT